MFSFWDWFFWRVKPGQALTEYVLILAIVAVAVVTAMGLFRDEIISVFSDIQASLAGDA